MKKISVKIVAADDLKYTLTDDWFERMTKKEQKEYIQKHPGSRHSQGNRAKASSTTKKSRETSSTNGAYDKKFDALFTKLVPDSGPAKTAEGELIRATAKVGYRWSNDGDKFYEGYGCQTAGSSATYLLKSGVPGIKELIRKIEGSPGDSEYSKFVDALVKVVVEYVVSKGGKYTKNLKDNLDTPSEWVEDADEDEDENDW
jgi:hypothetical protein